MKRRDWIRAVLAVLLLVFTVTGVVTLIGRDMRREPESSAAVSEAPAEPGSQEEPQTEKESGPDGETETESGGEEEGTEVPAGEPGAGEAEESEKEEETEEAKEPYEPPTLVVASDIHYQSHSITDFKKAYWDFVTTGDGKVVDYLPELLDAFSEEIIEMAPSAFVLSGDITMNGELENHRELSEKLKKIQDAGVQVLVIPGNHDINNPHAAYYFGNERTAGQPVTPEQFYEFYREFGYDQAISRDQASLSYVYPLDERYWMMMLDTCQYELENLVGGRLKEETLEWMDEQLKAAETDGVTVIPVGHHNLFPESSLYTDDCAMENYEEVTELFEKWRLPLYISGHLHVQRLKKHDGLELPEERLGPGPRIAARMAAEEEGEKYGIYEIVSDAISIPPCQYGVIRWDGEGNLTYETRLVDVSAWAEENGIENEDLLDFEAYSEDYLQWLISRKIENKMEPVSRRYMDDMTALYAQLYQDYYAGRAIDEKEVYGSVAWQWWMRLLPDSRQVKEMRAMVGDSTRDNNSLYLPAEEWE